MRLPKFFLFFISFLGCVSLFGQTYKGKELVVFEAIPESEKIVAGQPFYVGLNMKMAEGWHTYWSFSGEAGLATQVNLELPKGMFAGEVLSPLPILKEEDSGLMAYAYYDEVTHLIRLFAPAEWEEGKEIEIRGRIDWLVCREPCIPGDAEFSLTLTVARESSLRDNRIVEAKENLPRLLQVEEAEFPIKWVKQDNYLYLLTAAKGNFGSLEAFFPLPPDGVFIEIPQSPRAVAEFENLSDYADQFEKAIAIRVNSGIDQFEHLDGLLVFSTSEEPELLRGFLSQLN